MLHSTLVPEHSMTAHNGAALAHGLAVALIWWPVALVLSAARSALIRVQAEQRVQRVNLHLALGGSFEPRSRR